MNKKNPLQFTAQIYNFDFIILFLKSIKAKQEWKLMKGGSHLCASGTCLCLKVTA